MGKTRQQSIVRILAGVASDRLSISRRQHDLSMQSFHRPIAANQFARQPIEQLADATAVHFACQSRRPCERFPCQRIHAKLRLTVTRPTSGFFSLTNHCASAKRSGGWSSSSGGNTAGTAGCDLLLRLQVFAAMMSMRRPQILAGLARA